MEDVSKCSIVTCEKYGYCGYGKSKAETLMEFKHFCIAQDKYFLAYADGEYYKFIEKDKEEVALVEE